VAAVIRRRKSTGAMLMLVAASSLALGGCSDSTVAKARGDLTVSPGAAVFPALVVGGSHDMDLALNNTGSAELNIQSMAWLDPAGVFEITEEFIGAIPRSGSETMVVTFQPQDVGDWSGVITIGTDGLEEEILVDVVGSGRDGRFTVYPDVVDFGPIEAGDVATHEVTVRNEGVVDLVMEAGIEGADFSVDLGEGIGAVELPPGEERTATVAFSPSGEDAAAATLTWSAGGAPTAEVALHGNDCEATWSLAFDGDGDGFAVCADDCDDGDADVHPGAEETSDGLDNDCDGAVDEGSESVDDDGDGFTEVEGDCNDGDVDVHPGAAEADNGVDDDCDGIVDQGTEGYDDDGDGYAEAGGDCDDGDADVHPGAAEIADGLDQDCDGTADEGTEWADDDGDGFTELAGDCNDGDVDVHPGAPDLGVGVDWDCDGTVEGLPDTDGDGYGDAYDCDPQDPAVRPGAVELANGIDDDCDGTVDEGTEWYDDDGDGWSEQDGDCHDGDPAVAPGTAELADWIDNDCDGDVDEGTDHFDDDGDGYTESGGDCDDTSATIGPQVAEVTGNGVDDDCDGVSE